ncbi:SNF1-related protein kinase regulatory subunit beta-2-like isoform X2 [Zingiber officinale]|uniref:SNF1-related protein kinase regulatory subunit beta-2-like isoform X2 n=2 Tax=Zingiber officinale TaxID=94328 RepID=UPI001C4B758E|nr:SNF1-related protein kinase regulatory subunit beta-2-like isoform X2 [Zingiber officinale]
MGNVSSFRESGEGGSSRSPAGSDDLMGQSPPQSPKSASQSPLLFSPQIPVTPLQRQEEMQSNQGMSNSRMYDDVLDEQGIPTMINWNHGGNEVFVEGSWDNWKTKKPLQMSGKDFTVMVVLPSGFYQYRFIVDGEWKYAPDVPWMNDYMGNVHNILDLKPFVPENLGGIAGLETPQSPESSYNNQPLVSEDFSKEPPLLPPQLQGTLLDAPASMDCPSSLARLPHVVLNHLYIQKSSSGQPVVALAKTHRFLSKYVTVTLYKSLARPRHDELD